MASRTPAPLPSRPRRTVTLQVPKPRPKRRRQATVYDAVAEQISSKGFIKKELSYATTRDTPSSSATAVPPEEVLFRRKNAPTRYAEHDIYFANERRPQLDLPDSDLLKALHRYAADFYSRAGPTGRSWKCLDWKSLDGTALIALGILMEEASRLEGDADLVFTEEAQMPEDVSWEGFSHDSSRASSTEHSESNDERPSKRRRTAEDDVIVIDD